RVSSAWLSAMGLPVSRSGCGVGGWRGTRFTPEFVYSSVCVSRDGQPASSPFPSAPPRTVLATFRSTRPSSTRKSRDFGSWHLAYLRPLVPAYLSPFAMCSAFPISDYYEASVALGLAPRRRSWFSDHRTSERSLGHPLIPTPGFITRYLTARACRYQTQR